MKDEIKEILDRLKRLCYDNYCLEFSVDYIERKEEKSLLDYITNLQEENEMYSQLKDEYEDIIEKATEYINKHPVNACHELLNILQGVSKDER